MNVETNLKKKSTYEAWKKVGIRHHHGINVPLFSIHTEKSCGIGEYFDLFKMIDWCNFIGMTVIQLLPLNESGQDSSPYNALSSCALHPIYLSLHALPNFDYNDIEVTTLQSLNKAKRLNYHLIYQKKLNLLYRYIKKMKRDLKKEASYETFLKKHPWLFPYALFRALKDQFNHIHWKHWPEKLRYPSHAQLKKLYHLHKSEIETHILIQYLCFEQMQKVKSYAESKGVLLKGDIPILVSPDSVDVWMHPSFFNFSYVAGSPPTSFDPEGQYWGFPLYHWPALEKDHFNWWKQRLLTAQELYHIYRIDHVVGFFKIWAIPPNEKPEKGLYLPQDPPIMLAQGKKILDYLLTFTSMLPIGETLGDFPLFANQCLAQCGIPSTKIFRWERRWNDGNTFIPIKDYNPISMSSVSTHDLDTVKLWWQKKPKEAIAYARFKGWRYQEELSSEHQFNILHDSHHSGSLFHINLLQEYLSLIPELTWENPEDERINYPGTIQPLNWSYRYKFPLERLMTHSKLNDKIKDMLKS